MNLENIMLSEGSYSRKTAFHDSIYMKCPEESETENSGLLVLGRGSEDDGECEWLKGFGGRCVFNPYFKSILNPYFKMDCCDDHMTL